MITVVCLVRRAQLAYNRGAFRGERQHPRRRRPRTTATATTRLAHLPALLRPEAGTYGGRRRLRRFLEAVQYLNLTAFARAEGLAPSTISLQISRLERDFDGRLLDRGGQGHTRCV
jgi:cytochrome oxidase assembly protein ShyY1